MDFIDRDELRGLLVWETSPCVSIFLPTHRSGIEAHQQDTIRFKNLIHQAELALGAHGSKPPEVREILAPARRLLDDNDFWADQSDGLAVFLAPGYVRTYRIPISLEELVHVNARFHIKPLLPLLTLNTRFYVLALSQKKLRLLKCSRHTWREIELPGSPTSREEALAFDDIEKGMSPGGFDSERREALLRYLQSINRGVHDLLRDETAPLVLAGVEHLVAAYREVNDYANLVDAAVIGNPDERNKHAKDLHAAAWSVIEPRLKRLREEAAALYQQYKGQGSTRVSADIEQILPAASSGRIDTLFVSRRRQLWGHFDADAGAVELLDSQSPGAEDLLDLAAGQTLLNSGRVYASDEALPDEGLVAAVYRY